MDDPDDIEVLACERVADLPKPPVPSRRGRCGRCGMQVWIALSSPSAGKLIWCLPCVGDETAVQDEINVAMPTAQQIAEIKRYWRRRDG